MNALSHNAALLDCEAVSRPRAAADGLLIALCADYIALERAGRAEMAAFVTKGQMDAYYRSKPLPWTDEARNAPDRLLMQVIARLPAHTAEGVKAKADAPTWSYGGDEHKTPFECHQEEPLFSLLRDITGRIRA